MDWQEAVKLISPFVVRIETPHGNGTGLICRYTEDVAMVVTAHHVTEIAEQLEEPIEFSNDNWRASVVIEDDQRIMLSRFLPGSDTVVLFVKPEIFPDFPVDTLPYLPWNSPLGAGDEVGWLGFPTGLERVRNAPLCFFSGRISARIDNGRRSYLIDGTGIKGVSGGPVFRLTPHGFSIVGIISEYHPHFITVNRKKRNREYSIPGLLQTESLDDVGCLIAAHENLREFVDGLPGSFAELWTENPHLHGFIASEIGRKSKKPKSN